MRQPLEFSIELSAQELLAPPALEGFIKVADLCRLDTQEAATLAPHTTPAPAVCRDDDSVEIELTAAEMDALLSEDWKP